MCRMCLVEVEGPAAPPCSRPASSRRPRAWSSTPRRRRSRRRRTGCSSSCWPTTRSTARCATRAASARCRTRRWPTARARAASSRRSATSRSPSPSRTWCCWTASAASSPPLHPLRLRGGRGGRRSTSPGMARQVEVATFPPPEPFSSYFTATPCSLPRRRLTATPYRFTARPWDLDQVESTCTACSVGCRVAVQSSQNRLTRLLGIDSEPVNHGWLCDKGRFSFESVNGDEVDNGPRQPDEGGRRGRRRRARHGVAGGQPSAPCRGQFLGEARGTGRFEHGRLVKPRLRKEGELVPVSWGEALSAAAAGLLRRRVHGSAARWALIGGARLTNESAYAWAKQAVIGTDSVDAQLGDGLPADLVLGLPPGQHRRAAARRRCSSRWPATCARSCPVLFLRLREAVVERRHAADRDRARPDGARRARPTPSLRIRPGRRAADGPGPDRRRRRRHGAGHAPRGQRARADGALDAGRGRCWPQHPDGEGVVVVAGRPVLRRVGRGGRRGRCACWPRRCPKATFLPALRRGNVFGALDMGLAPGPAARPGQPRRRAAERFTAAWGSVPADAGLDAADILASMAGERDGGARPARRCAPSSCSAPTRSSDFPDRAVAEEGAVGRPLRRGRDGPPVASRSTPTPTSSCPARCRTSGPAPRPTWRAGSAASVPSSRRPASPGPTG